jgi:hypothetical protein
MANGMFKMKVTLNCHSSRLTVTEFLVTNTVPLPFFYIAFFHFLLRRTGRVTMLAFRFLYIFNIGGHRITDPPF